MKLPTIAFMSTFMFTLFISSVGASCVCTECPQEQHAGEYYQQTSFALAANPPVQFGQSGNACPPPTEQSILSFGYLDHPYYRQVYANQTRYDPALAYAEYSQYLTQYPYGYPYGYNTQQQRASQQGSGAAVAYMYPQQYLRPVQGSTPYQSPYAYSGDYW